MKPGISDPASIESLVQRRRLRRKAHGIAATLLPYESDGSVAVEAFQQHLVATHRAGLMNAVNMDTGYVNYLTDTEKQDVLRWTREALGKDVPFVAGGYIEERPGGIVALYLQGKGVILRFVGVLLFFLYPHVPTVSPRERA